MATTRIAHAHWEGSLMQGNGSVTLDSSELGTYDVTWASRSAAADGKTSPEELIAAAHSTCFSMALSHALAEAGHAPQAIDTRAEVDFGLPEGISEIRLIVRGHVDSLTAEQFVEFAEGAKAGCPVSKALAGTTIKLDAALAD